MLMACPLSVSAQDDDTEDTEDVPQAIVPLVHNSSAGSSQPVYNLFGQRVSPQHKGLVIHDGKKILNR